MSRRTLVVSRGGGRMWQPPWNATKARSAWLRAFGGSLKSAGLAVGCVRPTPAAELVQLEPVPRVRLVLVRHVVAAFAHFARQRDRRSLVTGHYRISLRRASAISGRRATRMPPAGDRVVLFGDFGDPAGTNSAATLTNREP